MFGKRPKTRKITRFELAMEQYRDMLKCKNKEDKTPINEDYTYKKNGYWVMRDNNGWIIALITIETGQVFLQ